MFLKNLRNRTAACHEALEQNPLSIALLSNTVSLDDYTAYLKKLYGFIYGFEKNIFHLLCPFLPDIKRRTKADLIVSDLLKQNLNRGNVAVLPDSFFKNWYPTLPAAWGGMYVLEGSILGGQIIQRHLLQNMGNGFCGSAYFTVYGKETGGLWKTFLQQLANAAQVPGDEDEIIDSAVQTFSAINTWMTSGIYETK